MFAVETPRDLLKRLVCLLVWDPVCAWSSPKVEFWTFLALELRIFKLQRTANTKTVWLITFFCSNGIFRVTSSSMGLLYCHCSPHRIVSVHILKQRLKLQPPWNCQCTSTLAVISWSSQNKDDMVSEIVLPTSLSIRAFPFIR